MRIRIIFEKNQAMRYTGHLDLHRTWERTFRRAGLPIAYSQGFHPQPKINLACALPLGFTSQCEIVDVWLEATLPCPEIAAALEQTLPPGIQIKEIHEVGSHEPALQTQVKSAEYSITLRDKIPDLDDRIRRLLSTDSILRQWRGKTYDLRPLIEVLQHLPDPAGADTKLYLQLAARERATGRPEEVLAVLGIAPETASIHRIKLILVR